MDSESFYFTRLAAAYVRGYRPSIPLPGSLAEPPLSQLTAAEMEQVIGAGAAGGLRLHRFKRTMGLPRVQRVLGMLKSMQPAGLLDIGSGRGAFLWPLLNDFPALPVMAVDLSPQRASAIEAVRRGGVKEVASAQMDATCLAFARRQFDIVTVLEVLEHIPQTEQALAEAVRVASRFVILSVPSKADNNPEHIHLFDQSSLRRLLAAAGAHRVKFSYVPNHLLAVVTLDER